MLKQQLTQNGNHQIVQIKQQSPVHSIVSINTRTSQTKLKMGLFDSLFGPKRQATASHILVKATQLEFLTSLKTEISNSKDIKKAFAESAKAYSTCPSSKKGGSLGKFSQGAMVPAFDKVVFSESLNVVHGPVTTPFGYHLILIDSRSD